MAQHDATPVTQPGLHVVTGDVTAPAATAPEAVTDPVTAGAAVPMTLPERGRLAVARWGGNALGAVRELWLHPGRLLYALWFGKAGTMKEHRIHVKSRSWVPGELEGHRAGDVIAVLGVAHHLLVARPVKAAMKAVKFAAEQVDKAADRILPFYGLLVFLAFLCLILSLL